MCAMHGACTPNRFGPAEMLKLLVVTFAWADDTLCNLQKLPQVSLRSGDTEDSGRTRFALLESHPGNDQFNGLWSTPGLTFQHCKAQLLQQPSKPSNELHGQPHALHQWKTLQPKPKCAGKQVPIGNFVHTGHSANYVFSCCSDGEQCAGCRMVKGGSCQQCAAGYVMQTIPVLKTSRCFICDDVPNWKDMYGRTCSDLQRLGICSGTWPQKEQDEAFHGLRPSEACCACGGGSIYPTPVQMPLQSKALYFGEYVEDTPQPITAGVQEVAPQCAFASSGLTISDDGFISGTVTVKNRSTIKCSIVSVQDPVRGLMTNLDFSLPVSEFSYGDQVIYFKFWGLNHGFGGFKDVQGNVLV